MNSVNSERHEPEDWLEKIHRCAEEEARRRGHDEIDTEHLALAFTRQGGDSDLLLQLAGVQPWAWRDTINTLLGANEGQAAEREHRLRSDMADSPERLWHAGSVSYSTAALEVLRLARAEAVRNETLGGVGPRELLVGLLEEGNGIAAGTGKWYGMSTGRARTLYANRAGSDTSDSQSKMITPASLPSPPVGLGPLVLHGGGDVTIGFLKRLRSLASRSLSGLRPLSAVLVDLGWYSRIPSARERQAYLDDFLAAGFESANDSGLATREDGWTSASCRLLSSAALIWLSGGSTANLYQRLQGTPALMAIHEASQSGAIIGGTSAGAVVWGSGSVLEMGSDGIPEPGTLLGWIDRTIVFAHYSPKREKALRERLRAFPGCRCLGLAHGGAIIAQPSGAGFVSLLPGFAGEDHIMLPDPAARIVDL